MNSIEVRCFATLAGYSPPGGRMETPEGAVVADVLETLRIPPAEVTIIFINGVHADAGSALKDGDRLGLFPPVGGG